MPEAQNWKLFMLSKMQAVSEINYRYQETEWSGKRLDIISMMKWGKQYIT
jgi:hypothetical protein